MSAASLAAPMLCIFPIQFLCCLFNGYCLCIHCPQISNSAIVKQLLDGLVNLVEKLCIALF